MLFLIAKYFFISTFLTLIACHSKFFSTFHPTFLVQVFSCEQTNVLTRQQLKLDWLECEQKTSICIHIETGFFDSLFSILRSLVARETQYAVRLLCVSCYKREYQRPRLQAKLLSFQVFTRA